MCASAVAGRRRLEPGGSVACWRFPASATVTRPAAAKSARKVVPSGATRNGSRRSSRRTVNTGEVTISDQTGAVPVGQGNYGVRSCGGGRDQSIDANPGPIWSGRARPSGPVRFQSNNR